MRLVKGLPEEAQGAIEGTWPRNQAWVRVTLQLRWEAWSVNGEEEREGSRVCAKALGQRDRGKKRAKTCLAGTVRLEQQEAVTSAWEDSVFTG